MLFLDGYRVRCPELEPGNSGAPAFVSDEIVGLGTLLDYGRGPQQLQRFLAASDRTRFLLTAPCELPDEQDQPGAD